MEETRATLRRTRRRRLLWALLGLLLLVGGLLGGAALWLESESGRGFVRARALEAVADALAGRLDAGAVEVSPTGHVLLRDVKLFTPEGQLVAELARLEADVDLLALRNERVHLSNVVLERPRLLLVEDERGWNLTRAVAAKQPKSAAAPSAGPSPWRVELDGLQLLQGFVDVQQDARRVTLTALDAKGVAAVKLDPLEVEGELAVTSRLTEPLEETLTLSLAATAKTGAQAFDLAGRLGGTSVRGTVELPALTLRLEEFVAAPRELTAFVPGWPLVVPLFAQGNLGRAGGSLTLRAGKAKAAVSAAVELARSAVPSFSVEVSDADLSELVGASLSSTLSAKLSGRLDDWRPESLAGAVEGGATWDAATQRLAEVSLASTAKGGTLDFSHLTLSTPGAVLSTKGSASTSQLALTGSLDAKDLARVSETLRTYAKVDTAGLRGRGVLALSVTGPSTHPAAKAVGTLAGFAVAGVEADSIHVDADVPDVTRPLNTDTTLRAKRLRVGERTFEEVTLDFYTSGRKLDLDLTTKGLGDLKVHVVGTLDRESTGAALDSAEVTAADTRWVMEGPGHLTWGERFELSPLTLKDGARRISARALVHKKRIDAEVSLVELDLGRLPRALAPPELELGGLLGGTVTVRGKLASPDVEAKATLRGGQVSGVTGLDADVAAQWRDSRAVGTVTLKSSVGALDGTFDVPVAALLEGKPAPASAKLTVSDVSLSALEPHLGRALPVSGTLGATLELSGSAEAPLLRLVVEAPSLDVDLDAEVGAPVARPPPPSAKLRGRVKQGALAVGGRRVEATPAPAPLSLGAGHRHLRVDRPKLTLFTTEAHTLSAEVSASALGGVAIVSLATPLTLARLREQAPTAAQALELPVKLDVDVQGVDLHAAHEAKLHDDDELRGLVSFVGALQGSAKSPRGALTLAVKRAAVPPLRQVDGAVTLRLEPDAIALDGTAMVQGKPALTLGARLDRVVDALIAAALAKEGDPLAVAGAAPFASSIAVREASLEELLPAAQGERSPGGTASATLEVTGSLEAPQARLFGSLQGLRFDKVPLGSARFDLRSQPRQQELTVALGGQGRDDLKVKGTTGLDLRLSSLRRGLDWRAATVDLGLAASNFDLGFLTGSTQQLRAVAGKLDLNGEVTGTLGAPRFEGDVVLTKGRLSLAGSGDYRDIALELHATNDRLELSRLSLRSGAGEAQVQFKAERQPAGSFSITGAAKTERFPVVNDDQLVANVSLALELQGEATDTLLNITRLGLPRVEVGLPEVKRKDLQDLQRPKDIIVLQGGQRPTKRLRLEAKTNAEGGAVEEPFVVRAIVDAPRNIWVRSSDVNVELGLSEGFRVEYRSALQLYGEASLLRGTIAVIGREFSILKGSQARFAGEATKPYVNVSALHVNDREQVKITVAVVGRGSDVSIKPSSEPAMPESDIYTVLATGRRQLQRGTGASLSTGQALSVIGQFVTSKAKTVLARALPIDVINFESSDDLQRVKVDVGKYLSDNLYLGASANIGADRTRGENVVAGRLEYQVTRSVSVEAYAGDALSFGVDALWSRDF